MKTFRGLHLLLAASGILMFSASVSANTVATHLGQSCELDSTCPIPGDDGGITYFRVTPKNGMKYTCSVRATAGKLVFWVSGGGDYKLESGGGMFTAQPLVRIEISGRFEHPNDPNEKGYIKFNRLHLPLSSEGQVTCLEE